MSWKTQVLDRAISDLRQKAAELLDHAELRYLNSSPTMISPFIFKQIPKEDPEGKEFLRLAKKYLNKKDWQMIKKGQKLKAEYTYKDFPGGYPNYACENYRIYFRRKERKE